MSVAALAPAASGTLAALDLGSNSFHMLVARVEEGELRVLDRLREPVRLAAGLDAQRTLDEETQRRGLDCLARFAQRLRELPAEAVRAVGTNTLRRARNGEAFRQRAEAVLGHRIDVIAGREEARLVYLGVAHALASDRRRLVVDVGGGSTEFIVGQGFEPEHRESLFMGCVGMSQEYFPGGRVERAQWRRALLAARRELEPIEAMFIASGWEQAVGCSGTVRSVAAVARAQGWSDGPVTRRALRHLRRALLEAGDVARLRLRDLRDDRRPVLAGGVVVLEAVFDALGIERMSVSEMALREGLLYDLLGRRGDADVREATVRALMQRYRVDATQAQQVCASATALLAQAAGPWTLEGEECERMLRWAAMLHEVGLAVSHNQYHKHGAYLLANADLSGFSRQEQAMLAALVRGHRRKFPAPVFQALPAAAGRQARRLCVLLRIAALLHRSRQRAGAPACALRAAGEGLELGFPSGWLDAHPLSAADLGEERDWLASAGIALAVS